LTNNGSDYESEPKYYDGECITADEGEDNSPYKSTDCCRGESCDDYDFGRSQETGISDEVSTSYRQHGNASPTEHTKRISKKSDVSSHQPGTTSTSEGKGCSSEESDVFSCQIGDSSTPEEREIISEEINAYSCKSGAACTPEEKGRGSREFYKFPQDPGAASTSEEREGNPEEFVFSPHELGDVSTAEQRGQRTEEVATSHLQPDAASRIDEREGNPEEFGSSPHELGDVSIAEQRGQRTEEVATSPLQPDATATTEQRKGRKEVCISSLQTDAAFTTEEIVGSSGETSISPHQPDAASVTEIGGAAAPSSSSARTLPARGEDSDKCPICLVTLSEQEVGTPDSCDHIFCVRCLKEWSKSVNTCPVDRQVFNVILVRRYSNREIIRRIAVRSGLQGNQYAVIGRRDVHFCEICSQSGDEDQMVTCNGCRLVCHVECLVALVYAMPAVEWLCPVCTTISSMFLGDYAVA
jgi:hypothetical protein